MIDVTTRLIPPYILTGSLFGVSHPETSRTYEKDKEYKYKKQNGTVIIKNVADKSRV